MGVDVPRKREVILMAFSKDDAEIAITATGHRVQEGKVVDVEGVHIKCCQCNKELTVQNVGRILPGNSIDLYCDDPTCFHDFSVKLV